MVKLKIYCNKMVDMGEGHLRMCGRGMEAEIDAVNCADVGIDRLEGFESFSLAHFAFKISLPKNWNIWQYDDEIEVRCPECNLKNEVVNNG